MIENAVKIRTQADMALSPKRAKMVDVAQQIIDHRLLASCIDELGTKNDIDQAIARKHRLDLPIIQIAWMIA